MGNITKDTFQLGDIIWLPSYGEEVEVVNLGDTHITIRGMKVTSIMIYNHLLNINWVNRSALIRKKIELWKNMK
jgi:hypothetical protein